MQGEMATYNTAPPGRKEGADEENDEEDRNIHGVTFLEETRQPSSMKCMDIVSHMGQLLITNSLLHCLLLIQDDHPSPTSMSRQEKEKSPFIFHDSLHGHRRRKSPEGGGGEDKNSVNYGVSLKVFDLENLHKRGCIFSSIQCMEFSLI